MTETPKPTGPNREDELQDLVREEVSLLSLLLAPNRHGETLRQSLMLALGLPDHGDPADQDAGMMDRHAEAAASVAQPDGAHAANPASGTPPGSSTAPHGAGARRPCEVPSGEVPRPTAGPGSGRLNGSAMGSGHAHPGSMDAGGMDSGNMDHGGVGSDGMGSGGDADTPLQSWPMGRLALEPGRNTKHALVADDNTMVREHTTKLLERLGYAVTGAENGPMALRLLKGLPRLDLLVTDVVMPLAMNGHQLAEKVKEEFPHAAVVYVSGFADLGVEERVGLPDTVNLLAKPFTRNEFNDAIRLAVIQAQNDAATALH